MGMANSLIKATMTTAIAVEREYNIRERLGKMKQLKEAESQRLPGRQRCGGWDMSLSLK